MHTGLYRIKLDLTLNIHGFTTNKAHLHLAVTANSHTHLSQILQQIGEHLSDPASLVSRHVLQLLQL